MCSGGGGRRKEGIESNWLFCFAFVNIFFCLSQPLASLTLCFSFLHFFNTKAAPLNVLSPSRSPFLSLSLRRNHRQSLHRRCRPQRAPRAPEA